MGERICIVMPWLGCPHGLLPGRTAKTGPEKKYSDPQHSLI